MRSAVVITITIIISAGCASRHVTAAPATSAPFLVIRDSLADSAALCVPQVKYTGAPFACISVGELRRQLRALRSTRLEGAP